MFGKMRRECITCSTLSVTFALSVFLFAPPCPCWCFAQGVNDPKPRTQNPEDPRLPDENFLDHHENGEFIHQLFLKYGDGQGRLSFRGFSALMGSIGLGGDVMSGTSTHDHRELGDALPGHDASTHRHVEHASSRQETQTHGDDAADEFTSHEPFSATVDQQLDDDLPSSGGGVTEATGDGHQTTLMDDWKHTHLTQCLSVDTLLDIFEIPASATGLTEGTFLQMCPVLLQQLDSHVCMRFDINGDEDDHDDHHGTSTHGHEDFTDGHHDANTTGVEVGHLPGHIWGYGIAAITLISFTSIACILVVPCMQNYPNVYHRLISFLVAMAVGSLTGDAMMHLIPHSLGIHIHDDQKAVKGVEGDDHAHETLEAEKEHAVNAVWKGFFVLIGIFLFFIIEQLMGFCQQARKRRKARRKTRERTDKKSSSQRPLHSPTQQEDSDDQQEELQGEYKKMAVREAIGEKLCHHCVAASKTNGGPNREIIRNSMLLIEDLEMNHQVEQASTSHHHHHHHHPHHDDNPENGASHHHGHSHEPPPAGGSRIATLAWIIVMGDGLHNFCDGMIVGAAFSDSIAGGLSTSIAVMCHEIPHELGDFAVMLKGGMSVKQALFVQAISSVLAYLGLAIGIAAGNVEALSMWIFALAGGMFVYIALVDLFPELIETLTSRPGHKFQLLVLQSIGTMVGVIIMLLIGLHEDWLRQQLDG